MWTNYCVRFVTGQNFFFGSDNRQQGRFVPFAQNQFAGSPQQSFVNYFPQTNAGPFLPFRSPEFGVQNSQLTGDSNTLASSNKFQRQQQPQSQFTSPSFSSEVSSDPRFDSLISSAGSFTSTGNEDYPDADAQSQSRFKFGEPNAPERQIPFRNNQIARFPPVAISEVTRSQDNPNSPNLLQTHIVNVHHTTRHPEQLPLAQNTRWRNPTQENDFNFRARNVPLQQFTSKPQPVITEPTSGEDLFSKFNRQTFLVGTAEPEGIQSSVDHVFEHDPTPQVFRHDSYVVGNEKKKDVPKLKNNRVKTNSNIQPTTYSPPVLLDNRFRNTPSTTSTTSQPTTVAQVRSTGQPVIRGRNKFSRPPVEERTTKAPKLKTTSNIQTRSPSTTTAKAESRHEEHEEHEHEDEDEFDVVTMSQDHLFVSDDNFKGWFNFVFVSSLKLRPSTEYYSKMLSNPIFHVLCFKNHITPDSDLNLALLDDLANIVL